MLNRTMISALALSMAMGLSGAAYALDDESPVKTDQDVSNPSADDAGAQFKMNDEFDKPLDRSKVGETVGNNQVVRDEKVNNPSSDDTAMNEDNGLYLKDTRDVGEPTVN